MECFKNIMDKRLLEDMDIEEGELVEIDEALFMQKLADMEKAGVEKKLKDVEIKRRTVDDEVAMLQSQLNEKLAEQANNESMHKELQKDESSLIEEMSEIQGCSKQLKIGANGDMKNGGDEQKDESEVEKEKEPENEGEMEKEKKTSDMENGAEPENEGEMEKEKKKAKKRARAEVDENGHDEEEGETLRKAKKAAKKAEKRAAKAAAKEAAAQAKEAEAAAAKPKKEEAAAAKPKKEEAPAKPKKQEDGAKPKKEEAAVKPEKEEAAAAKPKKEEAPAKPKKQEDGAKPKKEEAAVKPEKEEAAVKPEKEEAAAAKPKKEEAPAKPKKQEDGAKPKKEEAAVKPKKEEAAAQVPVPVPVPVVPFNKLNAGERKKILAYNKLKPASYWERAELDRGCVQMSYEHEMFKNAPQVVRAADRETKAELTIALETDSNRTETNPVVCIKKTGPPGKPGTIKVPVNVFNRAVDGYIKYTRTRMEQWRNRGNDEGKGGEGKSGGGKSGGGNSGGEYSGGKSGNVGKK